MHGDSEREPFFDLIVGDPASGKTALLLSLAAEYQEAGWQVIYLSLADSRLPNHEEVITARELEDAWDLAQDYDYVLLAIDELQTFADADERLDQWKKDLVRQRRHLHTAIVGSSQCPYDISPRIRKLYDRVYYFFMDKRGRDWLKKQIKHEGLEEVPEDMLVPPVGDDWQKYYMVYDKKTNRVTGPYKLVIDETLWRYADE